MAKREAERHESLVVEAVRMLIDGGYAEECEVHSHSYSVSDDSVLDEIVDDAKSNKRLGENISTSEIDEIFQEAAASIGDECGFCANNRDRED